MSMRTSLLVTAITMAACSDPVSGPVPDVSPADVGDDVATDVVLVRDTSDVFIPERGIDGAIDASADDAVSDTAHDATIADGAIDGNAPDTGIDSPAVDRGTTTDVVPDIVADAPLFDPSADHAALTAGVRTINLGSSIASALVVHGDTAFSVVYDANHATFVAASRPERGRVMVLAHESLVNNPRNTTDDRGVLVRNTVRWMTTGAAAPVVGVEGSFTELRTFLADNGFTVRSATVADLASVNVFITDTARVRTDAEHAQLVAWVRSGGGLIATGHAWFWGYSNENAALNYSGNKFLAPLGVTISSENDVQNGTPVIVRAPTSLDHAVRALERVRQHVMGSAPLTMADQVIASAVARLGVRVMDIASNYILFTRMVRRVLPDVIPTSSAPIRPASQPIPSLTVTIDSRLATDLPASEVTAHPAAVDFPGVLASGAMPVTVTRTIRASYPGRTDRLGGNSDRPVWRSTGLYAAPGARVTLTMPTSATSAGLSMLIGSWTDNNFGTDAWSRMPVVTRSYALRTTVTEAACAFGGLVYIRVPPGASAGDIMVTIAGAVPAPRYIQGVTTLDAWRNTERSHPGLYAEIETSKMVLTVPSSLVRTLDDPSAIAAYWNRVMDADADLAAIDRDRARAERIVFDRQIVAGYMHAGYPIMAFTPQARESLDLATLRTTGNWGFFHEIGHNHQFTDWSWTGTGENTVNLWSVYVMEHVVGLAPRTGHPALTATERSNRVNAYVMGGRNFARDWSVWTGLETFLQLQQGFGWSFFTTMNREYMALPEAMRPRNEAERINGWITRSCRVANRNLAPFYASWGFPMTDASRTACAAYSTWAENPMR
jgi:hypothetical protein